MQGLRHLSFLVVITCGDIYNSVTRLGHDQRCALGLWQDSNTYKIQYIPTIVVTNRHSVDRRRAERNYTRCKYQHM